MKSVVVFPSNREVDSSILDSLTESDIVIVEASGFRRPAKRDRVYVLGLDQQESDFGSDIDLLGIGSAAIRNYGIWWAYRQGYDLIINLDDDCWPEPELVQRYQEILTKGTEATVLTSLSGWVSTLHKEHTDLAWYPRGFPYEERISGHRQVEGHKEKIRPAVHMGLWDGMLDLNAVDKVAYTQDPPGPLSRKTYVTQDHVPICAMNFACLSDWAPFIYQIPWRHFGTTLPLWRYDDIIGGLICAALAHIEGAWIGFGPPFVDHRKKDNDLIRHAAAENLGNIVISRLAVSLSSAVERVIQEELPTRMDRAFALMNNLQAVSLYTDLERIAAYIAEVYRRWLRWFL